MSVPPPDDDPDTIPNADALLPLVSVDPSALRPIRTLFYSSTLSHEHLANLTAHEAGDPPVLRLTHLLPHATSAPPAFHTIRLQSQLAADARPPRTPNPTHDADSLLALLPPVAAVSPSGLVVHAALPRTRWLLGAEERERSSRSVRGAEQPRIARTADAVLARTGASGRAGVLLRRPHDGQLAVAALHATGEVAGVWAVGGGRAVAVALLALAAGLRRRSGRAAWTERRVVVARFEQGGAAYFRAGVLAVADGPLQRFDAALPDDGSPAPFRAVPPGDGLHAHPAALDAARERARPARTLGEGWAVGEGLLDARDREAAAAARAREQPPRVRRRSGRDSSSESGSVERRASGARRQRRRRRSGGGGGRAESEDVMRARLVVPPRADAAGRDDGSGRDGGAARIVDVELSDASDLDSDGGGGNDTTAGETVGATDDTVGATDTIGRPASRIGARAPAADTGAARPSDSALDALCRKYLRRALADEERRHLHRRDDDTTGSADLLRTD